MPLPVLPVDVHVDVKRGRLFLDGRERVPSTTVFSARLSRDAESTGKHSPTILTIDDRKAPISDDEAALLESHLVHRGANILIRQASQVTEATPPLS